MAEQSVHDVVNQTLSVGDRSPTDANVDQSNRHPQEEFEAVEPTTTDDQDRQTIEQDDANVSSGSAEYPKVNGVVDSIVVQPSLSEPYNPTDSNNQDSDFDGNISPDRSVGDLSAVSDADGRKIEPSATTEDIKNQDSNNAARRTASFKPVSFAKYSAAKVVGINSAAKASGEKVLSSSANSSTSSLLQGSRPRLVAKSTSGLRDNASKAFKSGGKNGATGPDPMQVWNKNRPAPTPSTKHLTDEELKQQYGIHMTSRIEADGESKEAKWADIDDDEDDWAPEIIEWADGTKVSLNHSSHVPSRQDAAKSDLSSENQRKRGTQEKQLPPPQAVNSIGPNATVLKVGANAERQQAQRATIVQKGPAETPAASAAKSPAPVPARSPWAPLPPVDKVPPITINPQVTAPPPNRYVPASAGGGSPSMAVAASPAKEISADDFNRSWRDSQSGPPRELFMPNSGRYEAVGENRRRSFRNDQNFRAPALLQRPTPGDQHAPAEPSPAFQTNRVSADQERGAWNRRRASSVQSGGSGPFARRTSFSKGVDSLTPTTENSQQLRMAPQIPPSDVAAHSRGVHVQQNINLPQTPASANAPGQTPDLNIVAEQKRLMQESARLAVQRRREEEQKEEAARKERIRLKLEQLGPPPDQKAKSQDQKAETAPKLGELPLQISSPPKPPVPEATGGPKQYGMMKVHHPDNVKKLIPAVERLDASLDTRVQDGETPQTSDPLRSPDLPVNGIVLANDAPTEHHSGGSPAAVLPGEENVQVWKARKPTAEPISAWSGRNHHPGPLPGNLWGPPNHDKALGNGTFDQRLTGIPARDLSIRGPTQQHNWLSRSPSSQDKSPQIGPLRAMQPESTNDVIPSTSPEQRPVAANSDADSLQPISKPLPIGPPHAQNTSQRWQHPSNTRSANTGVAAWNNFHAVAAREDRAETEKLQRELAASLEEEARSGVRPVPQYTFNETWKQVEISEQAGDRQVTTVAKGSINPSLPGGNAYASGPATLNADRVVNGLPVRGSRFFPFEARRAATYSHPELSYSPSPLPAEELGSVHPAYDGDAKRPVISFPVPKAVVKLPRPQQRASPTPPPPPSIPAPPRTFAAAAAAVQPPPPPPPLRAVSQPPLVSSPDWQHRFNDLLGRKSPPKKQVLAVASSSREPLEVVPINVSAAVSLPPADGEFTQDAGRVTSKDVEEEEDLFEDREAGSLPKVEVPKDVPQKLQNPFRTSQLRTKGKFIKPEIDAVSIPSFNVIDDHIRGGVKGKETTILIHFPWSETSIKKTMSAKKGAGTGGYVAKGLKTNNNFSKHNKKPAPKSREPSSSYIPNVQHGGNRSAGSNTMRAPSTTANGSVPTPRSGFPHNNTPSSHGWRSGSFASTGIAH